MITTITADEVETSEDLIKLSFRLEIDSQSKTDFEKKVWEDSYSEYRIQIQSFDQRGEYESWEALCKQIPKAKINVTYKTSFAIGLYVKELNEIVPGFKDNLGRSTIPFKKWSFEIVQSNNKDKQQHRVAITFETDEVELKAIVGQFLVISARGLLKDETLTIRMQPGISVSSFRTVLQTALIDHV